MSPAPEINPEPGCLALRASSNYRPYGSTGISRVGNLALRLDRLSSGASMRTAAEVQTFRKVMRALPTAAEECLWLAMLARWPKSRSRRRRQIIIGPYIADFVVAAKMLVIEVDGEVHEGQRAYDARRDAFLRSCGFTVVRFPNAVVLADPTAVLDAIARFPDCRGTLREKKFAWASALGRASQRAQATRAGTQWTQRGTD